jgi:uncharacterized protein (TIGR00290 family)
MENGVLNWSGGKDSTMTLYRLMLENYRPTCLFTTLNGVNKRISMHGVRLELLQQQVKNLGMDLEILELPENPSMSDYEDVMRIKLIDFKEKGVECSIFGDIFLEDLRKYREDKLKELGLKAIFPLWKESTSLLIREFIDLGFKTIVTCVNERLLDKSFVGRVIDESFLNDLPSNVDPCGENGEFHTFVFDGPIFHSPVQFELGEKVHKVYTSKTNDSCSTSSSTSPDDKQTVDSSFWFIDLILTNQ